MLNGLCAPDQRTQDSSAELKFVTYRLALVDKHAACGPLARTERGDWIRYAGLSLLRPKTAWSMNDVNVAPTQRVHDDPALRVRIAC